MERSGIRDAPVKLNLVVLRVANPEFVARFYSALGMSFVREQHGTGPEHFSGSVGGMLLELYPAVDGSTANLIRLGFSVPSVASAVEAALQAGGSLVSESKPGPWGIRAVIADPAGHKVEPLEQA